jgi:hypothetical protein
MMGDTTTNPTPNPNPNRLRAIWDGHANRAALWRALFLGSAAVTALTLLLSLRLLGRPREVIRIGCDGIPQLVRVDTEQYTEPNEREMQAFVRLWTVAYARNDSFSAVNDAVHAARYMVPELRDLYRRRMKGTPEEPGLVAQLQAVGRRTEIDPNQLTVEIDRQVYPWLARVRGERRVLRERQTETQPFALDIRLVRAPREQVLEGLLVQEVRDLDVVSGGAR